ncbi:7759_t:CDS:1 [Acaulospora colombiana]|uniref:7759_t:CDS:1 n=1 Tax=Acaulospora colombiana TaxID=27376 RepID=A0ACA9MMF0_9GLOM|nr:7759_t:CDS:1 [Acaulospora colombiana]
MYHTLSIIADRNTEVNEVNDFNELDVSDREWGDGDDSGWDDEEGMELGLVWKNDNHLEKTKRGPYMTGKTPKSTYYDKYGLNGSFTKAAVGAKKLSASLIMQVMDLQSPESNEIGEISSDSESDLDTCRTNERAQELKKQLEKEHNQLTVTE